MPFDSILRVFSAEFSEFGEYLPTLIAIVVSLMATWYFAFNSLTRSTVRNRFRDLIRGERSESESMNNPSDGAQESQGNQDESPPGDGQDTGTSPADFRAAGDGWEGDEDIDYVLDEDILNQVLLDQNGEKCDALPPFALNVGRDREQNNFQLHAPSIVPGAYSDEDSDDDRVILRRIIEAAEEATTPTQQPEIAQVPPAATDQQPVTYNSTDDLGDTETEVSMTDDTDAETHAFHARGHDKGGVE